MFKEIKATDIKENLIKLISDEWMLITAGNSRKYNMMTASWGFAGEIWGSDSVIALIRPTRYTMEFVEKNDHFTLSFYGKQRRDIHKICGNMSGRNTDKTALTGLTPVFCEAAPFFKEARLVLICKKQYTGKLESSGFNDKAPLNKWYNNDLHNFVIGKIEKVLIKE